MVAESWFRSLWKTPKKHEAAVEKAIIGVLAFEVASLMSKMIHLWQSLTDKQVARFREEITNSVGIKKLISDDDEYIVKLICTEMIDNVLHVAKAVARLGKKCNDPTLKSFEQAFNEWIRYGVDPNGWAFTWKKMERKAKKMEKFISLNANLYQEMEVFADLEQTLRRMKSNEDSDAASLLEFEKKVTWKKHEVKRLKDDSLWNRTYDYTVLLLARFMFTLFGRIKHVFGAPQMIDIGETEDSGSDQIYRSQSVSAMLQSSAHQSESSLPRFASGPLGKFAAKSGPMSKTNKTNNFYSGPISVGASTHKTNNFYSGPISVGASTPNSGPVTGNKRNIFHSGPIGRSTTKSGPISGISKMTKKMWQTHDHSRGKKSNVKANRLTQVGPFKGCMMGGNSSPVTNCHLSSNGIHSRILNGVNDANTDLIMSSNIELNSSSSISNSKLLAAPPDTLGAAALSLHYANVVVVIEKLAASPHLIGLDARDDLYNMLPVSVRTALRAKLKPCSKSLASSSYDPVLAGEWNDAMTSILEWLGPLAHNTIRWQSERSFEQQNLVSRANVLLVQTLYFANQEKTEAMITELLVGLNYIWRFGRELNAKALLECASGRVYDEYLELDG
ncbi:protein PSK SIMULATOR 2 [Cannabis sativa]|uniref:DUF668 domain-containing protein n=1 Tax=Cannabis sativa TaxID=3483 RepID=A0A7J6FBL7_CANSA|nr:protein PSK SIMULATOR 2 [Cannabis sativa]XP_030489491.2 protein PSK SIMULATOR 2 [Cannabis sativa]KAF4367988.1 hypothetical protein F8388_002599 [Cannabis sativa]KAF4401302.1 hypothetical protein G4B88_014143 [Cannabis sativa]